jgi:hypothetical protein
MIWECKVLRVNNGFVVTYPDEVADEKEKCTEIEKIVVFEFNDEEKDENSERKTEVETLQKLFYWLMEYFAIMNSKHEKYNLNIDIENKNANT